jgi:hypothetical protein
MLAHAGVALDLSTARTWTAWGAKTFLIARLTTIHVTTDSTAESLFSIEIDEIAALGALPLLINDGFLESRIYLCHIHYGLPISGLLSDCSNHIPREIPELQLLLGGCGHDNVVLAVTVRASTSSSCLCGAMVASANNLCCKTRPGCKFNRIGEFFEERSPQIKKREPSLVVVGYRRRPAVG